ncbi:uncharacterized protein MELLADRAFT_114467 [Melampsora larici-populina 98AG31]|uniref:Uncharacterized protein n=1 Tax=Melampsora larici-populina (strain 98AG31 / pathotype 3-4-7) TaxID=747676 RepID=F4SDK9_MELLP|nr:uncharacterized protein MELLADRAFT_114467 [Melampsora larici-populina 98AG31]EGF97269.1 hypothetical protein MELLADRAFT_114467 [Melampsora larici-populina 98AG31]
MTKNKKKSTSPTTISQMILDAQKSGFAQFRSEEPISLSDPPPHARTSRADDIRSHPLWSQVQSLNDKLRGAFLAHDYEIQKPKIKKDQIYRILLHFDPNTEHRVTHRKDKLINAFETELLPRLGPFIQAPPPQPMETDVDFDPLTATQRALREAIHRRKPALTIPEGVNPHGLRLLYKEYVDNDLVVPAAKEFSTKPRGVTAANIKTKTIEQLRFILQSKNPEVFIHLTPLTRSVCVDIYTRFVLEEEVAPGRLILQADEKVITFELRSQIKSDQINESPFPHLRVRVQNFF